MKSLKLKLALAALLAASVMMFWGCSDSPNGGPIIGSAVSIQGGYYVNNSVYIEVSGKTGKVYAKNSGSWKTSPEATLEIYALYENFDGWKCSAWEGKKGFNGTYSKIGGTISVTYVDGLDCLRQNDKLTYQSTKPN